MRTGRAHPPTTAWIAALAPPLASYQYAGNTVSHRLYARHMGHGFGLPYPIFVGLRALSITGVVMAWHQRRARARRVRAPVVSPGSGRTAAS